MRQTTIATHGRHSVGLPRGWVVLSAALASWVVFAVVWTGMSQLFGFIVNAI